VPLPVRWHPIQLQPSSVVQCANRNRSRHACLGTLGVAFGVKQPPSSPTSPSSTSTGRWLPLPPCPVSPVWTRLERKRARRASARTSMTVKLGFSAPSWRLEQSWWQQRWGPSAYEVPQKQDLTIFLEYNV
jgi:hypothetical protein